MVSVTRGWGEHLSIHTQTRRRDLSNEAYPYAALLDRAQVREAAAKSREDMVTQIQGAECWRGLPVPPDQPGLHPLPLLARALLPRARTPATACQIEAASAQR